MFQYEIVPGFFAQDDPNADAALIGATPAAFGLLDTSSDRWSTFRSRIENMNTQSPSGTSYKVVFFGRHGEGYHNLGKATHGPEAWDGILSRLEGDGTMTWGPDPQLTPLGVQQAEAARALWITERAAGAPLPDKMFCSPFQRALKTCAVTFGGVVEHGKIVLVLENLRERSGVHTCDRRHPRSRIIASLPTLPISSSQSQVEFEIALDVTEEDTYWDPETRETMDQVSARARSVLDRVFGANDAGDTTFVSITAHVDIIEGFLLALGRGRYSLPTGGVIPVVVKATKL
ncbi:hypothetical protein PLICRDRAFT_39086 [Plicaturopsis crispa FD-325 SS-3]|nr:hypothetical protein PLICRDRAFT_39086 [Plicaturopsis crispa FD-325 SS-3]